MFMPRAASGWRARTGRIELALWLIGLGLVFLAQQLLGLPWVRAWPLFLILIGATSLLTTLLGTARRGYVTWLTGWSLLFPLAFLGIGSVLLLNNLGRLDVNLVAILAAWWPVILIVLGAFVLVGAFVPHARHETERLSLPLEGATEARVRLKFGAGELRVGRTTAGGLLDGDFVGGVSMSRGNDGEIELEPESASGWLWAGAKLDWRIGLSGEVPLDLRVESGAARTALDLTELRLRSLRIATGASETRVSLPRAAGRTTVKAEAGAASLSFEVPEGVAGRIRGGMVLGSTDVDQRRFPRIGDHHESPDFESATNRVEIEIEGGVGSVQVR
jgi:hypothetical protein